MTVQCVALPPGAERSGALSAAFGGEYPMTSEPSGIKDHILKTIDTMETLGSSQDFGVRRKFNRMIGDQYEALIALSASELREMAGDPSPDDL
ncbi:hypothetical protein ABIE40_004651 [Rhizobium sp. OAE497]